MQQARISKFFIPKKSLNSNEINEDLDHQPKSELVSILSENQFRQDSTRHQKFIRTIGNNDDDDYDEHKNLALLKDSKPSYTLLEKQVISIRQKCPDSILMVECGYRMRFFGNDAIIASKVLKIYSHEDHNFIVASIPTFRTIFHCRRLLKAGYKVAIVRQLETAAIRKSTKTSSNSTFQRDVVGIFTEGTIIDDDDPAFEGLISSNFKAINNDDSSDEEETSMNGDELEESQTQIFFSENDKIISIVNEIMNDEIQTLIIFTLNITSNQIQLENIESFDSQSFENYLDSIQPCELLLYQNASLKIKEVVTRKSLDVDEKSYLKRTSYLSSELKSKRIIDFFKNSKLVAPLWVDHLNPEESISIIGLIQYLFDLSLLQLLSTCEFNRLHVSNKELDSFTLDYITLKDLEVFSPVISPTFISSYPHILKSKNQERINKIKSGGLFALLDNCKSIYGRRTLRNWLINPLKNLIKIKERQEAVTWIINRMSSSASGNSQFLNIFIEILTNSPDIEKMITSLQLTKLSPARTLKLLEFAERLKYLNIELPEDLPFLLRDLLKSIDLSYISAKANDFRKDLLDSEKEKMCDMSITKIFTAEKESSFQKINDLKIEQLTTQRKLEMELENIKKILKKPLLQYSTLRTGAQSKLEYLIELSNHDKVPEEWTKVSSTKNVSRYHTPIIMSCQDTLFRIRDEVIITSKEYWKLFLQDIRDSLCESLRISLKILSQFDALLSLAKVARYPGYIRPNYSDGHQLNILQARHPTLDLIMTSNGKVYIPNDVSLAQNFGLKSCQIITGPNMGGKSSYVRMIALICLLGQIGSYIPADYASMCIFDSIYTRMGAEDDLATGKSTFMCELLRMNKILGSLTPTSLVIIDELGRGTATVDGQAIAIATLRYILEKIGSTTLFITHFPMVSKSIESDSDNDKQSFTTHMSFVEQGSEGGNSEIVFLYKMVRISRVYLIF